MDWDDPQRLLVLRAIDDRPYRYTEGILTTQSSHLSNDFRQLPAAFGEPMDRPDSKHAYALHAANGRPHPRPLSLPHGKEPPAAAICNRVTEKPSFL